MDPKSNRRLLYLQSEVVNGRSRSMLLREAAHELVHAEQFAKAVVRNGGDISAARRVFQRPSIYREAVDEVVAETVAQRRIGRYLGGLSESTLKWSNKYIQDFRIRVQTWRNRRD